MKQLLILTAMLGLTAVASAQTYIESLSRGVVALPAEHGNFVSWRYLSTDSKDITFDVLRDGQTIAKGLSSVTNYTDEQGSVNNSYSIVAHTSGDITPFSSEGVVARPWAQPYLSIPLDRPADVALGDGRTYNYTPNDCSCGDLDGDGEYEIILKWDCAGRDNSHDGFSGDVILDAYKINYSLSSSNASQGPNRMWRINLGRNIRGGAHYTQFLVYDFDGDGKSEVVCKTAPGSIDGKGDFVTKAATDKIILKADNSADYVERNGRILTGPEYLTVFAGNDGHAVHTIFYNPNRAFGVGGSAEKAELNGKDAAKYDTHGWGDRNPGNRGDRFLACVAFLGGKTENPSAVMCRGYYTRSYLWAVDFDGKKLSTRWLHVSPTQYDWKVLDGKGKIVSEAHDLKATAYGQGVHSIAVGDVDDDGCDEITYGSAAINNDGTLLYSTGLGHGDAQHLGDLDPDRPGLEFYMPHEAYPYGSDLRDARTGEVLFRETDKEDTGRGIAADIDPNHRGYEFWCAARKAVHAINGEVIKETKNWTPQNFRIYWDGDLQDELIGNGSPRFQPGSNPNMIPGKPGERPRIDRSKRMPQTYYIAKWNGEGCDHVLLNGKDLSDYGNSASCNGTKATPCLQADLFGDWREELVLYDNSDKAHLNIFTTNIPSPYRVTTLMHDHIYRMGIAWQNVAYNQPPHLGYYLEPLTINGK